MSKLQPIRLLHFADAHIDIANYGRHDPETGIPIRVTDFLNALDQIIDAAIEEKVDLVIFAGDAYKDRNPQPTFQRAWGKRMMRLSAAGIPTLLLVGNHDVSPAIGRAHTLHEFSTLSVPHIHVGDALKLWQPEELGVPVQIIAVPWLSRSMLVGRVDTMGRTIEDIYSQLEELVSDRVSHLIEQADPDIPLILTAHTSVSGAKFGSERAVMLGHELVLSGGLVNNPKLDYVALGHIHKPQVLSGKDSHPPIVYPGSIERIDFGEKEDKRFVLAEVGKGETHWEFRMLKTRRFIDPDPITPRTEHFMEDILSQLPAAKDVADAICRVRLTFPRDDEPLLDERAILEHFQDAFEVKIQKHYLTSKRSRLGDAAGVETMSPLELLETYWVSEDMEGEEIDLLLGLAKEVLADEVGDKVKG
ncbi:MAG: exonuclease SbcCD subunit D [Ardenticatenaceae bacterium]|nr:exonuclease SbcCD subunit D [Anaerolineales bacterium]MCB8941479.1 exonuclease SbcCD subunit D [Ardenticatenaceae bacterium]MCB8974627.1 exonuclease SbcCD subunit D [Ardenticatenaceae bacterium]